MPFNVKKNAISRAIFGYKRKSESVPINCGRSPATITKLDMKRYDILPSRRNKDDELLPHGMEQDIRNEDSAQAATLEEMQPLPTFQDDPESKVLNEDRRASNRRASCENEMLDFKDWNPNSVRPRLLLDESCQKANESKNAAPGPSYPRHVNLRRASASASRRAHVQVQQSSNDDNFFTAFDDLVSRRHDEVKPVKQQSTDTKKIIPHVSPISPPAERSPLRPRALAPSRLKSRALDPPGISTFLPTLDPPGASSLSRTYPSKPNDTSARDFAFFVATKGIPITASNAPSPSRRDTPPRRAQRRGSARNSPVSPFSNQNVMARQSETALRLSSLDVLPKKQEQMSDIRQHRLSHPSTAQELRALHPPRRNLSAKSSPRATSSCRTASPMPMSGGLTFPEMESKPDIHLQEFDWLAERRGSNRFEGDLLTTQTQEVQRRVEEQPSSATGSPSKGFGRGRSVPIFMRSMKPEHPIHMISPRRMRCFSEDLGTNAATGLFPDTPLGLPCSNAESAGFRNHDEMRSGHNLSTEACIYDLDANELEGSQPNKFEDCGILQRAPLSESRRVLNTDDPSKCTFWVTAADGLCEHLEIDVESAQPQRSVEDFLAHKGGRIHDLETRFLRSSKAKGEVNRGLATHESNALSRNCMTPSNKKTSRRRKLKSSLSFRSSSTKSRLRRSFSFSSVR